MLILKNEDVLSSLTPEFRCKYCELLVYFQTAEYSLRKICKTMVKINGMEIREKFDPDHLAFGELLVSLKIYDANRLVFKPENFPDTLWANKLRNYWCHQYAIEFKTGKVSKDELEDRLDRDYGICKSFSEYLEKKWMGLKEIIQEWKKKNKK